MFIAKVNLPVAGLIWRTGATGIRARIKQVAYVLEATMLARHLKQIGIHHLHNHIGMSSAHVAMLASKPMLPGTLKVPSMKATTSMARSPENSVRTSRK